MKRSYLVLGIVCLLLGLADIGLALTTSPSPKVSAELAANSSTSGSDSSALAAGSPLLASNTPSNVL